MRPSSANLQNLWVFEKVKKQRSTANGSNEVLVKWKDTWEPINEIAVSKEEIQNLPTEITPNTQRTAAKLIWQLLYPKMSVKIAVLQTFIKNKIRNKGSGYDELIIARSGPDIMVYFKLQTKWRPSNIIEYFKYENVCPEHVHGIKSNINIVKIALASKEKYCEPSTLDLGALKHTREIKVKSTNNKKIAETDPLQKNLEKADPPLAKVTSQPNFNCPICFDGLLQEKGRDHIYALTCGHTFHEACLTRLKLKQCPKCKRPFRKIIQLFF